MKAKLTPKERLFCKLLSEGRSGVDAYIATHENVSESRSDATLHAYRFKQNIIRKLGYEGFLDLLGVSDEAITRAHTQALQSLDERVKLSATKLGYQIRGRLIEQQRVDANVTGIPTSFVAWLRQEKAGEENGSRDGDDDPETTDGG